MADVNDRLIVELSADVSKLETALSKAGVILAGFAGQADKHAKTVAGAFKRIGDVNVNEALAKVFDRSRLKVMEEGAAQIGLFGGALEALGPIGLTAAAGLAATAVAFEQAKRAAEWATELQKTATALGLTVEAVQKLDLIATAAGIPIDKMRESMKALGAQIGVVQDNLTRGKQNVTTKAFEGILGTDDPKKAADELRELGTNLDAFLPKIVEAAEKLGPTQRLGLAKALKVDPEVLNSLVEAKGDIAGVVEEAQRYGIIVDSQVIKKSAEAGEKLRVASYIIDKELLVAFADLAPVAAAAADNLVKVVTAVRNIVEGVSDSFAPIAHLISLLDQIPGLKAASGGSENIKNAILSGAAHALFPGLADAADRGAAAAAVRAEQSDTQQQIDAVKALLRPSGAKAFAPPAAGPKGHTPHDNTDQLVEAADRALAEAIKAEAEAHAKLTENVDARAQFELEANDAEAKAKQAELDAQIKKLLKDKTIDGKLSDQLQAELELAKTKTEEARVAKATLIARQAELADIRQSDEQQKIVDDYFRQIAQLRADMAPTQAQRTAILRQDLLFSQAKDRQFKQHDLDSQVATGALDPSGAKEQMAAFDQLQAAQRASFEFANKNPLAKWLDDASLSGEKLKETLEGSVAHGLDDLASGLAQAIVTGGSLGDVAKRVFQQIATDLLTVFIKDLEKQLIGSLLSFIPGFADGTESAPGGLAIVGERGPELVNLPRGSQVIANHALASLGRPVGPGGRITLITPIHNHYEGAVLTSELLSAMDRKALAAQNRAVAQATQISSRGFGPRGDNLQRLGS